MLRSTLRPIQPLRVLRNTQDDSEVGLVHLTNPYPYPYPKCEYTMKPQYLVPYIFLLLACFFISFWHVSIQPLHAATRATPEQATPEQAQAVLQVASVEREPFVVERGTGYIGYSIELWDAVADELGLAYELTIYDTFPEMLATVQRSEANLAIANITITAEREAVMDFSHPIYLSGLQILLPSARRTGLGLVPRAIINSGILWVIGGAVLILLIVAHLIWFFETGDEREFNDSYRAGIWDAFWWSVVTITTVGYGDKVPRSISGRVVALIWMFFSMFLLSIFVAQVSNIMSDSVFRSKIEGPADLLDYRVATIERSTADSYLIEIGAREIVRYQTPAKMFAGLARDEADAIVFDAPVLAYYEAHEGSGEVKLVGSIFKPEQFGIALQHNSQYREAINQALLQLSENGTIKEIHDRWFSAH